MKTMKGEKVLLCESRVWINDKPKFGTWKPLTFDFFRNVSLQARRVKGYADFDYQAVFGHTGMYKRDYATREFLYPPPMAEWVKTRHSTVTLDEELRFYAMRFPIPLPLEDPRRVQYFLYVFVSLKMFCFYFFSDCNCCCCQGSGGQGCQG